MHIREYAASDDAVVGQVVAIENAGSQVDSPWLPPATPRGLRHRLTMGWDGEPSQGFVLVDGDRVLACGSIATSDYDNLDFADLSVCVAPADRRRGFGSALLDGLMERAGLAGRTKVGMGGWDTPASAGFARRHGFEPAVREVNRQQDLRATDWPLVGKLHDEAAERADGYELLRILGQSPPELLPALAEMTAAINDAPLDDLDIEDEVFPPERVAAYETSQLASGVLYRVVARHRGTGALAGHTVVHIDDDHPWIGWQHDTSVVAAHRGRRLGLLLKTDMLHWLRDHAPEVTSVSTWNAKSNGFMIGVNEVLGYRVMGESVYHQRRL